MCSFLMKWLAACDKQILSDASLYEDTMVQWLVHYLLVCLQINILLVLVTMISQEIPEAMK